MLSLKVPDMTCGHCTAAIEKAVKAVDPAATLTFDLKAHQVSITPTVTAAAITQAVLDAGYESEIIAA